MSLLFIEQHSSGLTGLDEHARKKVRKHAMRNFRRKQRRGESTIDGATTTSLQRHQGQTFESQIKILFNSPSTESPSLYASQFSIQLQDHFGNTFYPSSDGQLFFDLSALGANNNAVLKSARNVLRILNLAIDSGERSSLCAFYELYGKTLRLLANSVRKLSHGVQLEEFLSATYILTICEALLARCHSESGWQHHSTGLLEVVCSSGPHAVAFADTRLSTIHSLQNWRTMTLSRGLMTRKAVILDDPSYNQTNDSLSNPLLDTAMGVPRLLELLDKITSHRQSCDESTAMSIVESALTMRDNLKASNGKNTHAVELVNLTEYPYFHARLGRALNRVFSEVYRFPDLQTAGIEQTRCLTLLTLNQAILDAFGPLSLPLRELYEPILKQEMDACAASLCRSLPFLSAPNMGNIGLVASTKPLHFATLHYERYSDEHARRLLWCQKVKQSITLANRF